MADQVDVIKNVKLSLPEDTRNEFAAVIDARVPAVVRSIAQERYWTWRQKYKVYTKTDGSSGIYTGPDDCQMIADEGMCLVDTNNMPIDYPVIYLSEKEFNERFIDLQYNSGVPYYVVPLQISEKENVQFRIYPDLGTSHRLKVWYYRDVTSQDIRFMRDLVVIYKTLETLPIEAFGTGSYSQKNYSDLGIVELNKDILADKRMAQDRLEFQQPSKYKAHYSYLRRLQGG